MTTYTQFRFYAIVEEAPDKKTNVHMLKWIQPVGSELYYEFPTELQDVNEHPEICAIIKVKHVLSTMKTRGTYRIFTLTLPSEIAALYTDAEGDITYREIYLQATMDPEHNIKTTKKEKEENISTLLQQIVDATNKEIPSETTSRKNIRKIHEDFVLEHFNGKNFPVSNWFQTFEQECARCQVTSDEDKILILGLFLDGAAKDWFSSKVITIGLNASFEAWKEVFLDSFRETGWDKYRESYTFRYVGGSLVDYALRKENLLVNIRDNFPTDILIDLIVIYLPIIVQFKIEKTKVTSMKDLLAELRKLESLVQGRKTFTNQKNQIPVPIADRTPCPYCEKRGSPGRFHPEALCKLKKKEQSEQ